MNESTLPDDLPADLRAYLETVSPVTSEMKERIATRHRAIDSDPAFQAEYLKSLFIEKMYAALEERGEAKAALAGRLGKTRQYVQKLFDEDKRVNFTVETLCSLAHALGRRILLQVCRENEHPVIVSHPRTRVVVKMFAWRGPNPTILPAAAKGPFIASTNPVTVPKPKEALHEYQHAA